MSRRNSGPADPGLIVSNTADSGYKSIPVPVSVRLVGTP